MFEERLIAEVQKYPHIYNRGDIAHRNKANRDRAWLEVASALDESKEQCQSRWRTLRDRYVKELNKEGSAGSTKDPRPWKYMENMDFLRDHVVAQRTLANFEYADDSEEFQQADNETSIFLSEDSEFMLEKQQSSTSKPPPPKKAKVNEAEEKFCALVGTVQNILSAKVKASRNAEFLAMLDTYLHKLNDDQQDFLKIEILNFVYQRSRKIKKGSSP